MDHLVRQSFGGVIAKTALFADEAAVQKNKREKVVRFQLNSGGEEAGLACGVPGWNPAGAETELFPGQIFRLFPEGGGDFRRVCNQHLKSPVSGDSVQLLFKAGDPFSKRFGRFSGCGEEPGGVELVRRA